MLDLNEVAMFVQVVRAGSFAEAARRLDMPSATLSRRVMQLESALGVRLLQRSTRSLSLTEAGRSLHERSANQVEELLEVGRQLLVGGQEPGGLVRIAAPADFFEFFLMEWIRDFLAEHPNVQLDFVLSDSASDLISEGIDVAFRGGELPDSSLIARQLGVGEFALAASPGYLQAHGHPANLQDLSNHDCIRMSKVGAKATWHLDGPDGATDVVVTGRFSASTAQAQLKAAVAGMGICFLPKVLLNPNLQQASLEAVLPDHRRTSGGFYVVYPSRRYVPRAVSVFVDAIVSRLAATSAYSA